MHFCFSKHWASIRGAHFKRPARIQDRVNLLYPLTKENVLEKLHNAVDCSFKLQASFGFILEHVESHEQRYFHPSQNNAGIFSKPPVIASRNQLEKVVDEIFEFDPLEWARTHRPDTKWRVKLVAQLTCYLNRIKDFPIGGKCHDIPRFISRNTGINHKCNEQCSEKDELCLFRCLSMHRCGNIDSAHVLCKQMTFNPKTFKGICISDLHCVEKQFQTQIWVYSLEKDSVDQLAASLVRRSPCVFKDRINLDLNNGHFSLISNLEKYSSHFPCGKCGHVFTRAFNAQRHERLCRENVIEIYPGGIFKPPPSLFNQLEDIGVDVTPELRIYPYRCVFDIEVFFAKTKLPPNSESTEWENSHEPASIGITSNVKHFTKDKCLISNGDSQRLVNDFMEYLEEISNEAYRRLRIKLNDSMKKINQIIKMEENRCEMLEQSLGDLFDGVELKYLKHVMSLKVKLEKWMATLVVLGFNSGKYDMNVLIPFIVDYCKSNDMSIQPLKRGGTFISLLCGNIQFLDICNYLGAGTSYDKYLKAYNPQGEMKSWFPYEWFTSLDKLNQTYLPPHAEFHSNLKGKNISPEEYKLCEATWKEKEMQTMRDYLIHYQMLDVRPFLVAISKQIEFYEEKGLDLFKSAFSLPGISFKYVFATSPLARFMIFNKSDSDVAKALQNQMTGGPAIVFAREAYVNKSKIKQHIYGANCETVRSICGYDSNSLYLSCTGDFMPTGYMQRRKAPSFKLNHSPRAMKAAEWLEYVSHKSGKHILHELNRWPFGEKKVGGRMYAVDGFLMNSDGSMHVYEMHGCMYHAHSCMTGANKRYSLNDPHIFNSNMTWNEIAKQTAFRDEYIRQLPNTKLMVLFECEWEEMKKRKFIHSSFSFVI